jgi:hypothetical protein
MVVPPPLGLRCSSRITAFMGTRTRTRNLHHEEHEEGMSRETMTRYKDGLLLYSAVPSLLMPCFSSLNLPRNFVLLSFNFLFSLEDSTRHPTVHVFQKSPFTPAPWERGGVWVLLQRLPLVAAKGCAVFIGVNSCSFVLIRGFFSWSIQTTTNEHE